MGKYWLLILPGSGFHLHHIVSFLFIFFSRPAVLTSEGDGWISLCSFADRRAGSTSVLVYFGFVLAQGFSTACAQNKKFVAFGETLLLWFKMERDPGELWSVMRWVRVTGFLQLQPLKCKCELMMGIVSFHDSRGLMQCQHICFNCYLLILTV